VIPGYMLRHLTAGALQAVQYRVVCTAMLPLPAQCGWPPWVGPLDVPACVLLRLLQPLVSCAACGHPTGHPSTIQPPRPSPTTASHTGSSSTPHSPQPSACLLPACWREACRSCSVMRHSSVALLGSECSSSCQHFSTRSPLAACPMPSLLCGTPLAAPPSGAQHCPPWDDPTEGLLCGTLLITCTVTCNVAGSNSGLPMCLRRDSSVTAWLPP
jgi:hypothetical protein